MQAGTELGRAAKAIIDRGELVSDEIVVGIVRERLAMGDVRDGFILDGFPRTVRQASALDEILKARDPLIIIELAVPDEELVQRLSRRRVCGQCGAVYAARDAEPPTTCAKCGGDLVLRERRPRRSRARAAQGVPTPNETARRGLPHAAELQARGWESGAGRGRGGCLDLGRHGDGGARATALAGRRVKR